MTCRTALCLIALALPLLVADASFAQFDVVVSGAGDPDTNGDYKEAGDDNGKPFYQHLVNTEYLIIWSGSAWQIYNTNNALVYYDNTSEFGDWVPRLGWQENKASGPPTLSGSGTRQPLAGTYVIGTTPFPPSAAPKAAVVDYASIGEAVDSLNSNGISDDVTFAFQEGSIHEQVEIEDFPRYGSSTDSLLITTEFPSDSVTWEFTGAGLTTNYFLRLDGPSHVTIDGLEFYVETGTPAYGTIVSYGNVDDFVLRHCYLDGRPNAPDAGHTLVNRTTVSNSNVSFLDNEIWNGYLGVEGSQDILVARNAFRQQRQGAIEVASALQAEILDNSIEDFLAVGSTSYVGIDLDGTLSVIGRNRLEIDMGDTGIHVDGSNNDVENNMVAMLALSIEAGIEIPVGASNITARFNTVWVDASSDGDALEYGGTNTVIFNNQLINEGGGRAIGRSGATFVSNFNNLYTTGPELVQVGHPDLAAWQASSGSPDPNSVSKLPDFVETTSPPIDLHLTGASDGDTDFAGVPLTDVPIDIDGDSRTPPPPYMGADQATPLDVSLIEVELDVLLEGPFAGAGTMSNNLRSDGHLTSSALNHPYGGPPWNYSGSEAVLPVYYTVNPDIVDWIYLRLYSGDLNGSIEQVDDAVAFVKTSGDVQDLDGTPDVLEFEPPAFGDYYLAVYHRNHIPAIASDPISFTSYGAPPVSVNFDGDDTIFGTNPMKSLAGGYEGLFAADDNADGQVTATDFNTWLTDTKTAATGYLSSDFNMDGQVTASDFNSWLTNTKVAAASQIP